MENVSNMSNLFDKLNDLKSLFFYGQKIIPIIQNLIDFMHETVPLLENINNSIAESASKIPKATNQITNVTSATELATTEILDIVDLISNEADKIEVNCNSILAEENAKTEILNKLKEKISGNFEAVELLDKYLGMNKSAQKLSKISEALGTIKNNAYNITLSLQVQDITAQQLAAVNHLIFSVQEKLSSLIYHLEETDVNEEHLSNIDVPIDAAFDPNASYSKSSERQDIANELIKNSSNKTSQDEIDKLFS